MGVFEVEVVSKYIVAGANTPFMAEECALKAFQAELKKWENRKDNASRMWCIHVTKIEKNDSSKKDLLK